VRLGKDEVWYQLAIRHQEAVQEQNRFAYEVQQAKELRDWSTLERNAASEYVWALRATALGHLIRFYRESGRRPRIDDDL